MKKIYFAFILLAIGLVSCNKTDDLWDEVDDLKDRVTSLETQIKDLNWNIEAIRELAKEGATITGIEEKDGAYKITMSDGKVLNLIQYTENSKLLPVVGIDAEGYWVVSYNGEAPERIKDSNGNEIMAKGENGVTPKFSVDAEGYWMIQYGSNAPERVKDENGNDVKATGDSGGGSSDSFFEKVEKRENELYIKLATGEEMIIPIASNFSCVIDATGVQSFAEGEIRSFNVTMKGVDNTMITAPSGWKAELAKDEAKPDDATAYLLKVTAPSATSASTRVSADSSKDIAILATSGAFACIAKIQVEVKKAIDYKTMFNNGEDITIGGVTVNKNSYTETPITKTDDMAFDIANATGSLVVFLDENTSYKITTTRGNIRGKIAIIGRNPDVKPTIEIASSAYFSLLAADGALLMKNVRIDMSARANYLFNQDGAAANMTFGNLAIEDCVIDNITKPLVTIAQNNSAIKDISIQNTKIQVGKVGSAVTDARIVSIGRGGSSPNFILPNMANFEKFTFTNNIVYSNEIAKFTIWLDLDPSFGGSPANANRVMTVDNNTLVNCLTNNTGTPYVRLQTEATHLSMQKNIFYTTKELADYSGYCYSVFTAGGTSLVQVQDNKAYNETGDFQWLNKPGGSAIDKAASNPLSESNFETGSFVSADPAYGAQIK